MIVLYDDVIARGFEPFATTRPFGEMRAGAVLGRERWAMVLNEPVTAFISSAHLRHFTEFAAPPMAHGVIAGGNWVVNTRALPTLQPLYDAGVDALTIDGRTAAVRVDAPIDVTALADGTVSLDDIATASARHTVAIDGVWMDAIWDVIRHLPQQLVQDIPLLAAHLRVLPDEHAPSRHGPVQVGAHPVFVEAGATIEPYTVFDTTAGPVLVREHATIRAFTRLVGPLYVGPHTTVSTDRVAASSIGEHCRVHGELSMSVFIGYANKGHDGFVGHSLVGRWVNFGAGTITSNLKNNYGTVSMWSPDGMCDTGLQFAGTFLGDHAKTGIGLRLNTGSIIGAGANVMEAMPPKVVAPFSWGTGAPYATFVPGKFLETATRVMRRREVVMDPDQQRNLELIMMHAEADHRWPR